MFTRRFWRETAERAAKSGAQALILYWSGDRVFSAWDADWPAAGGVLLGAVALSVLTSIVSAPAGEPGSPSLV